MLFKKKDEATKLIELVRSEQKQLDDLNAKLESIRPKWNKLQDTIELLEAKQAGRLASYRKPPQNEQGRSPIDS